MIVIPPVLIDSAKLVAADCTIPEPDAARGEVVWVSGGTYALGVVRVTLDNHRKYECVTAHSGSAVLPKDDPVNWQDVGATNRWAMFDTGRNTQSVGPVGAALVASVTPGQRCNALFLGRLQAAYATVVMHSGGVEVFRRVIGLMRRNTRSWRDYYFGGFRQISSVMVTDLPLYAEATITVELDNGSQPARCASMVVGRSVFLGDMEWGGSNSQIVFGGFKRDDYGNATALDRRTLPGTSQSLLVPKDQVEGVVAVREALGGKRPAVWSGLGDKTADGYAELFLIWGFHTLFKVTPLNTEEARVDLELEEF